MIVDFEVSKVVVEPVEELSPGVCFSTPGFRNYEARDMQSGGLDFRSIPVDFNTYAEAFGTVMSNILAGKTYLLNLCFPSEIQTGYSLEDIFFMSRAMYKLWYKDRFVVFSPETFVTISSGTIRSRPMKGTRDAALPRAKESLLEDEKELAEHATIVDLIRNDLSIHAREVTVEQFRYIDKLTTSNRDLLQTSSVVSGKLPGNYLERLGEIIFSLLPAGSVSGAPKKETLRVIREAEGRPRGFYTGIMGYFDGKDFDSAVLIRFIERHGQDLRYWSGGGITFMSRVEEEYRELKDKIYVPFG